MAVLHTEYIKYSKKEKPQQYELDLRKIIESHNSEDYSVLLADELRWEIFYHLSQLRTSIINWYEFDNNADVLEIGGGFGALTGALCDRCQHVSVVEDSLFRAETIELRYQKRTNLDIYVGDLNEILFTKLFDYVVLVGKLEEVGKGSSDEYVYARYLKELSRYLKPNGKLLIAVENRYGIRYFCGEREPHIEKPFAGINRYYGGTPGYTFSKKELSNIIKMAEFPYCKFYYPLPDYKLTQLIYSDQYLPEKNLQERLIPYYRQSSDTLVALEHDLYHDLIENEVFPFFSNSFFVECSKEENLCSIIYAAISTDRGKEKSFATTIHVDQRVKKTILYKEGISHLQQLYLNVQDLLNHQVPVVEHTNQKNYLEMPFINAPTLSIYMRELIKIDKEKFEQMFDRLYEYVLSSSEAAEPSSNKLLSNETKNLDWGVILRKAYIELIPLNCFYHDGTILFFDQEFVRDNYPAKYILFRALHYMYGFAPHANAILPLSKLKEKYGLTKLWDIFVKEEEQFIIEIRQHKLYHQFYQWTRVDRNRIKQNIDMLSYKGENLMEYDINQRIKAVQEIQLDLLTKIKLLCEKYNLRYFLFYGSLLGAVRHNGNIPWDDDIDIVLPREDYEKLIRLAKTEFREPYFLQIPENDPSCFYGGYAKFRNSNTTGLEMINWGHECNQGIWIDVFPLDLIYTDKNKNLKMQKRITYYQRLLFAKVYHTEKSFKDMKKLKWKVFCLLSCLYSHENLCLNLNKSFQSCNEVNSKYLGIITHYTRGNAIRKYFREDFEEVSLIPYEQMKLPIPIGYQRCLTISMGNDYMRYPARVNRKPHHKAFFAPNVPYKVYRSRFNDIFKDINGKTLILFGAGLMFDDYMDKYGKKYPPNYIVDNDSKKWGSFKNGIMIKNPNDLLSEDKVKLHLIICNIYYRQVETQIRKMGITDYYIYVQDKEWLTDDPPRNNI